jgi:hypothetical protein
MKILQYIANVFLLTFGMVSSSFAIVSCSIEVKDASNNVIASFVAARGEQFGNRKVKKLHDCDTCWNGGKDLGPRANYCGTNNNSGEEYVINCNKNSGAQKHKIYPCP